MAVLCRASLVIAIYFVYLQIASTLPHHPNGGRIINGTLASMEATGHQVSVRRKLSDSFFFGTGHICGGSLIAPNVVLSAAHCFADYVLYDGSFLPPTDFIVVMGNLDRFVKNELTLVYEVEKIVYDSLPLFNFSTFERDIALLFLNGSVPDNHKTVKTISLNRNEMPAETICQVTGWGDTELQYSSDVLLTVDVPIIARDVCANETNYAPESIQEEMICAGYLAGERDACQGDSGGPLVCKRLLTGIVSWGDGCAQPKSPGVYTDVAYFAPWIDEEIKKNTNDGALPSVKTSFTFIIFSVVFSFSKIILN